MATWRTNPRAARAWHALTVLVVTTAVITELVLIVQGEGALIPEHREPFSTPGRVLNFFSYFTIQSNILLAIGAATLVVDPQRDGPGWRVLRFSGVLGMTITGIVFVTVLRPLVDLDGVRVLTNAGEHYVGPVLAVVGWLLFGPRPRLSWRIIGLTMLWPIGYLVYTLIRGELVAWYPYPFVDVIEHGLGRVLLNSLMITALFMAIAWAYLALDRRFSRVERPVVT